MLCFAAGVVCTEATWCKDQSKEDETASYIYM